MKSLKCKVLVLLVLAAQACSKQAVYDNVQTESRWDCAKLPLSQQQQCREQSAISYQAYQRERQKLLQAEPDQ